MARTDAGDSFQMTVSNILEIDSPRPNGTKEGIVSMPAVVHIDDIERHALVAMEWGTTSKSEKCLGSRWFYRANGHPISNRYAVWFVIPQAYRTPIVDSLGLPKPKSDALKGYLSGSVSGDDLKILFK